MVVRIIMPHQMKQNIKMYYKNSRFTWDNGVKVEQKV